MTVTVYRSDDVGAPTLTSEEGGLITLLDAVLVNGYGAKAAAGWTKPFSGTNQAVYRNSTANGGMGCFFQVDDSKALSGSSFKRMAKITGATNCTGFNAFTNSFTGLNSFASKSSNTDVQAAYVVPWIVIADEHTIMLFCASTASVNSIAISSTAGFGCTLFGDYSGWEAGQPSTSVVGGGLASSTWHSSVSFSYTFHTPVTIEGVNPSGDDAKTVRGDMRNTLVPSDIAGRVENLHKGKHLVREATICEGGNLNRVKGVFRGINYILSADDSSFNTGDTATTDGKELFFIRIGHTDSYGVFAIETSPWISV